MEKAMLSNGDSPFWKIDETFPGAEPGLGVVPALEPKETGAVFIQIILYLYLKKIFAFWDQIYNADCTLCI